MSKSGGVFQIDDVTRTMSKGGGVRLVFHPSKFRPPPPPGWLATGLLRLVDYYIEIQYKFQTYLILYNAVSVFVSLSSHLMEAAMFYVV